MSSKRVSDYWKKISKENIHASTIDPTDRRGLKNSYIASLRDDVINSYTRMATSGEVALNFGCGHGDLDPVLIKKGYRVIGLDITKSLLDAAQARMHEGVVYVQYDGENLPFKINSIDLVVSYGVLIYLDSDQLIRMLSELRKVLKENATVVFVEQCRRVERRVAHEAKYHWTVKQWVDWLDKAGYHTEIVQACRLGHMPLLYLIRWGLWPRKWWRVTMKFEQWFGKKVGIMPYDYADIAFICKLRKS